MPTPDFSKIWASASPLPEFTFTDAEYTDGWDFVGSAPPTKNQFDAWFRYVDERLKWLYDEMQATASKLYPVGSVYISFNSTDPSVLFGGTWVRLKDSFLLASGDTYAPNTSGGSATKTITTSNLPAHNHTVNAAGNHTHTRGTMEITGVLNVGANGYYTAGAFESEATSYPHIDAGIGAGGLNYKFTASKSWTGNTSLDGSHTHTTNNTGSGLPLNIMPPYLTVYMWKRTA